MDALLWLVAGTLLLVAEIFTLTVVLGMVGVGALVAALAAALGAPVVVQAGAFVVSSTGLLVFAREPVQKMLNKGDGGASSDARALTGSRAMVVEQVTDATGQVRLNGELWRARPYAVGDPMEPGSAVSVAVVQGATLLVYPSDLP